MRKPEPLIRASLSNPRAATGIIPFQHFEPPEQFGGTLIDTGEVCRSGGVIQASLNDQRAAVGALASQYCQCVWTAWRDSYQTQGRYTEAQELYKRALAINEQRLGALHPSTAQSLNNLAELYQSQSEYKKTEELYKRAFAIREEQLGSTSPVFSSKPQQYWRGSTMRKVSMSRQSRCMSEP